MVSAQEEWEKRFEGWRAAGKTRLQMMELVQSLTHPSVTITILDYLDGWKPG